MCSLEDAWGTTVFMGAEVESQADDRVSHMKTPDNLFFPKSDVSPLTKPLPNKNKFTRGIQSCLSRQQRVPNQQHNLRGNNGVNTMNVNVSPILSNQNTSNTPLLNEINNGFQEPTPVSNEDFVDFQNAFGVSNTVDKFMNMGMNMSDDYESTNFNTVNNRWQDLSNPHRVQNYIGSAARCQCIGPCNCRERMAGKMALNKDNAEYTTITNLDENSKELKKKNEEIVKLLGDVLDRLDKLENKVQENKTVNIHDIILYLIIVVLVITVVVLLYRKK